MDMRLSIAELVKNAIGEAYPNAQGVPEDLGALLEVPPEKEMGDFAFPCFKLSKALRMGPPMIAKTLAEHINAPETARVECVGGYLNFFFNRENFARQLMQGLKETAILGRKRSLGLHAQQFGHRNIQFLAKLRNIIYVRTGQSQFPVADRRLGVSESGSKLCLIHSGFGTVLADDLTDMRTSFCIDDRAATSTSCFLL